VEIKNRPSPSITRGREEARACLITSAVAFNDSESRPYRSKISQGENAYTQSHSFPTHTLSLSLLNSFSLSLSLELLNSLLNSLNIATGKNQNLPGRVQ
jgi:hypothetical protein